LVGVLSAVGEDNPNLAWDVNVNGLNNVLELCLEFKIEKLELSESGNDRVSVCRK